MDCQKCGKEIERGARYCGACGITSAGGGKALCDGCMGAFEPGALAETGGRMLCRLCADREESRSLGVPEAGNARRLARQDLYEQHYPPPVSALAILSVVCAFLLPILGIPAIVLGAVALVRIRSSNGALGGEGVAIAGIALGALTLMGSLFCIAAAIPGAVSLDQAGRAASDSRAVARIREIESAQQVFRCDHGTFGTEQNLLDAELLPADTFSDRVHRLDVFLTREGFKVTAVPRDGSGTHFLRDEQGEIRAEYGRPATEKSSPWNGAPPRPVRQAPARSG